MVKKAFIDSFYLKVDSIRLKCVLKFLFELYSRLVNKCEMFVKHCNSPIIIRTKTSFKLREKKCTKLDKLITAHMHQFGIPKFHESLIKIRFKKSKSLVQRVVVPEFGI